MTFSSLKGLESAFIKVTLLNLNGPISKILSYQRSNLTQCGMRVAYLMMKYLMVIFHSLGLFKITIS